MWLAMWLVLTGTAQAVSWQSVVDEAEQAWTSGGGASSAAASEGLRRAGRVSGPTLTASTGVRLGSATNQEATASLGVPLGLGLRDRSAFRAEASWIEAQDAVERGVFVDEVVVAWSQWWTTHELLEHLGEWSAELDASEAVVQQAADEGFVSPLDAADFAAERLTVRAELAALQAEERRARALLASRFGLDTALDAGSVRLEDWPVASISADWQALADAVERAPVVVAAEQSAAAEQARARQASTWRPELEVGVAQADGTGQWETLGFVGVQAPLAAPGRADARAARGRAEAERRRADWLQTQQRGAWLAEAAAFTAAQQRAAQLNEEVVGPLTRRVELLETAFAAGQVPAHRLLRARRELHEAEHARLLLVADLLLSSTRAQAVGRAMEAL